MNKQNKLN